MFAIFRSFLLVLGCAGLAIAAEPPAPEPPAAPPAGAVPSSLEDCVCLALRKQPAIAAARASLAAATASQQSLAALHLPTLLAPELPIRRSQAALGVTAAAAGLNQAIHETVYAVTRNYFSVLYAREQERVARGVVERLKATGDAADRMLKAGAREANAADVEKSAVYQDLAEVKRIQASEGVERALAALREAIGLGPDCAIAVPDVALPHPEARPDRHQIIAWAVERRAGLIQANTFVELTALEIEAQTMSHHIRMETFAAGGDIHSRSVPAGYHNAEYRPGGIPPEMPVTLAGPPCERAAHACALHVRAAAVAEKTRNLIVLEAENAFRSWEESSLKAERALQAAQRGEKLADSLSKDFVAGLKVRADEVINVQVVASQARGQYNEFLYGIILALADLERITAGGFCAGLVNPDVIAPKKPAAPENK